MCGPDAWRPAYDASLISRRLLFGRPPVGLIVLTIVTTVMVFFIIYWWSIGATIYPLEDDWYPETMSEWRATVDELAADGDCDGLNRLYDEHFRGDRAEDPLYAHWEHQMHRLGCDIRITPGPPAKNFPWG